MTSDKSNTTARDVSGIAPPGSGQGALILPIRNEKMIVAYPVPDSTGTSFYSTNAVAKRLSAYSSYMTIRMLGRGGATPGKFDPGASATYRFLINPHEVHVQRQTLDEQAYTRGGWQIGVWGEDFISVTVNGKSPGKYYAGGLTDWSTPLTESYRNLLALEVVVENNGYWYEGEERGSSFLSGTTRRIKTHQDVTLVVGDFLWDGMFESMEITEDANSPHLVDFSIAFTAWRERYFNCSPYLNPLGPIRERGHVPATAKTPPTDNSYTVTGQGTGISLSPVTPKLSDWNTA